MMESSSSDMRLSSEVSVLFEMRAGGFEEEEEEEFVEGSMSAAAEGRCETASTASEAKVLVVEYIMLRRGMEQRFRWIPVEDWEEEELEEDIVVVLVGLIMGRSSVRTKTDSKGYTK